MMKKRRNRGESTKSSSFIMVQTRPPGTVVKTAQIVLEGRAAQGHLIRKLYGSVGGERQRQPISGIASNDQQEEGSPPNCRNGYMEETTSDFGSQVISSGCPTDREFVPELQSPANAPGDVKPGTVYIPAMYAWHGIKVGYTRRMIETFGDSSCPREHLEHHQTE